MKMKVGNTFGNGEEKNLKKEASEENEATQILFVFSFSVRLLEF